jgi:hypothetical protein
MADFWAMVWAMKPNQMTHEKCAGNQGDKRLMGVMGYHLCIYEDIKIVKNGSQQREWWRLYTHDLDRP